MESTNTAITNTISAEDQKDFLAWKKFHCKEMIKHFETLRDEGRNRLDKFCEQLVQCKDENEEIFVNAFIKVEKDNIAKMIQQLKQWEFKYRIICGNVKEGEQDLTIVKMIPIGNLLESSTTSTKIIHGKRFFSCPSGHPDKTPSFCWYVRDNRAYCFSCSKSFDVIDVMMVKENCDFKTAINLLSNY